MSAPVCPYCGEPSKLTTGATVYPHRPDLSHKLFFRCEPCDAHVGVHETSGLPLGRLADATLRRARIAAHAAFDPIWRGGSMKRGDAYALLAKKLGVHVSQCHIGHFDTSMCRKVVTACTEFYGISEV